MRVFVTGASGYIGQAVAKAFRFNGHDVWGLVRTDESAKRLKRFEIRPVIGSLEQPNSLKTVLSEAEAIVHCAFDSSGEGVKRDEAAIDLFVHAAAHGSFPKSILYTSGVWIYGNTKDKVVDESAQVSPLSVVKWRPSHEERLLKAESPMIRPVVIRPGCVYGGKGSLTSIWFESAQKGKITIAGNGENRWAMVHIHDLARLFVKAAEKEIGGLILNGANHSRDKVKEMAEAIQNLRVAKTIHYLSDEEAKTQFGPLAEALKIDQQVSSRRASLLLDWHPRHPSFIQNVREYYEAWLAHLSDEFI